MNIIKIILSLLLLAPVMSVLSGCYDDSFLDSVKEGADFVAPYDIVLSYDRSKRTVYFPVPDSGSTVIAAEGDDASHVNLPEEIQLVVNNTPDSTTDPVVEDSVTGLTWTKCSAKAVGADSGSSTVANANSMDVSVDCSGTAVTMAWSNAVNTCRSLNKLYDRKAADGTPGTDGKYDTGYGGYSDWRLPRLPEILTIVNYNSIDGFDSAAFPGTKKAINDGYWTFTSKLFVGDDDTTTDYGWIVYHRGGGWGTSGTAFKPKLKADFTQELQYVRCVRGGLE